MKRIAFSTLGCKANYADTEAMAAICRRAGIDIVPFDAEADAYVVNTCTVTAVADQQSRQLLRRPKRLHPGALVVATGCAGEVDRTTLAACGIDAVFGTKDRDAALAFLFDRLGIGVSGPASRAPVPGERQSRARAFLKIQDGCARRCAYCIVPRARGTATCLPPDDIERACLALGESHREIILTGIDIGQYRHGTTRLIDLLKRLARIDAMPRLRISSIDPTLVDDELIEFVAVSRKICRHVHLSIQSGSDEILAAMRRPYGAAEVRRAIEQLCHRVDGIAVTGDVIAGFPGETHADHRATAGLLAALPIAGLHVFPYSAREGTEAAAMPGRPPQAVRRLRAAELREIAQAARQRFLASQRGRALEGIVTSRRADDRGRVSAFTDNAIAVSLPAGVVPYGGAGRLAITAIDDGKATGLWESLPTTRISSSGSKSASGTGSNIGNT